MTWRGHWCAGLAIGVAVTLAGCVFPPPDEQRPPPVTVTMGCGSASAPTQVYVGETVRATLGRDGQCDGFALGRTQLFTLRSGYFGSSVGGGAYAEVAADGSYSFELPIPADMRLGRAVVEAVPALDPCDEDELRVCVPPSALVTVSHRPSALRTVNVVSSGLRPPPLPDESAGHAYVSPGPARNQLTVVILGNSCESVPTAYVTTAPRDSLELVSRQPTGEACGDAAVPWTSIVDVPARYAGFRSVKVDNVPAELLRVAD